MNPIVRTIYGDKLQTCRYLGQPYQVETNSTVNEGLFNTTLVQNQPTFALQGMYTAPAYNFATDSDNLQLGYVCIGNGGHRFVVGTTGGVPKTSVIDHYATSGNLYRPLPFVVVPVTNDLGSLDQARFRLRKTMLIGGVLYAAYFARVLDLSTATPVSTVTTVVGGIATPSAFTPTVNTLAPAQPAVGTTNNGAYVAVTASISIPFSAQDALYLRQACQLIYGDEDYAIISEMAFCHGMDKDVTKVYHATTGALTADPVPLNQKEAVGVQVSAFISCFYSLVQANNGLTITVDLGNTEPLFGAGPT